MFVETIIATLAAGFLAGMGVAYWLAIRPEDKARDEQRLAARRALRQAVYREEARREHKGTPYISPAPSNLERLLADIESVRDDYNASRRAPDLRVVS